jgi:hypothetical protein
MITGRSIERLIALHAGCLAPLIVKANAANVKVHFWRKTAREGSKFPTANYRRYANA